MLIVIFCPNDNVEINRQVLYSAPLAFASLRLGIFLILLLLGSVSVHEGLQANHFHCLGRPHWKLASSSHCAETWHRKLGVHSWARIFWHSQGFVGSKGGLARTSSSIFLNEHVVVDHVLMSSSSIRALYFVQQNIDFCTLRLG